MSSGEPCLFIADQPPAAGQCTAYILSSRPELDGTRVLIEFFTTSVGQAVHPSAHVAEGTKLGRNVRIGANTVITADVEIGDQTRILNNVVIDGPARIGRECFIKDGAVIGSEGYGFVEDEEGRLLHCPQLGRIVIGDRVWIGANSTIERAMLTDTIIENDVKIDDLVHIGNGSQIGPKCLVTAGAVIAYDVQIGAQSTISPNAVIRESIAIAPGVTVGQGAVVVQNLDLPGVYVGVPARLLRAKE